MIGLAWIRRKAPRCRAAASYLPDIVITVLGITAGAWGCACVWHSDTQTRILGVPFTAGVFEWHDGQWIDHVGSVTPFACAGNLIFWVLLFRLPLLWYTSAARRTQTPASPSSEA